MTRYKLEREYLKSLFLSAFIYLLCCIHACVYVHVRVCVRAHALTCMCMCYTFTCACAPWCAREGQITIWELVLFLRVLGINSQLLGLAVASLPASEVPHLTKHGSLYLYLYYCIYIIESRCPSRFLSSCFIIIWLTVNYVGESFWKLEKGRSLRGMSSILSLDKLCTFWWILISWDLLFVHLCRIYFEWSLNKNVFS